MNSVIKSPKSDPIQGILFKVPPVHLQGRAMQRAYMKRQEAKYFNKFFMVSPLLRLSTANTSRRFKTTSEKPQQTAIKHKN